MEYGALTIDTSIFDGNNLQLEAGLLKKIEQFKSLPTTFLIPDIVQREVNAHLIEKIDIAKKSVNKAVKLAGQHLSASTILTTDCKNKLTGSKTSEALAEDRLNAFITNTGAKILDSSTHTNLAEILNLYFDNTPPFGKKDKKSEFPDAIALKSLESWAITNETKVLAVSTDSDWKAFADQSTYVDVVENLSDGLAMLQTVQGAFDFSAFLATELMIGGVPNIDKALEEHLADFVPEFETDLEAYADFYYEPDFVELTYTGFEYVEESKGAAYTQPVYIEDDYITIDLLLIVKADASCGFSFSVKDPIDRDYVTIGSGTSQTSVEFEVNVLITLQCDLSVEEIEIIPPPLVTVNFEQVEPDFGYDD